MSDHDDAAQKRIFRFKLEPLCAHVIATFAHEFRDVDRIEFRLQWERLLGSVGGEPIRTDIDRLELSGCNGDIENKLFKSARYYYRKKTDEPNKESEKRKKYVPLSKALVSAMDVHISNVILSMKPSEGFIDFEVVHGRCVREEMSMLNVTTSEDHHVAMNKIKKTYKNRYFLATTRDEAKKIGAL